MLATGLFDARALFALVVVVGELPAAAAATRGFLPLFLVGGRLTPAAGADGSTVVLVTGRLPVTLTTVVAVVAKGAVAAGAAVVVAVTGGADATARGADAGTETIAITGTGGVDSVAGVTVVAAVDMGTGTAAVMMVPVVVPALIASAAFLASFSNIAPMFVLFFSTIAETGGRGDACSVEGVDEASTTADGAEAVVGATAGASTAAALTVVVVVLFATADEAGGGGGLAFG